MSPNFFEKRSRRGFSLVVSLVMMALMLMIAITLVSFVYVQARLTESKLKRTQAQINAISGMRVALGQLQLLTGDDQRVTATADIFGGAENNSLPTGGEAFNGKRFWTGVWATGGLDKTKLRDWSIYSPDKKPFLGWLVSDYDSSKEVYAPNESPISKETATKSNTTILKLVQEDFRVDDKKLDLVTLVGKGTLGSGKDAADELSYDEREVKVRRVPLVKYSAASDEAIRPITGSFAYWVGDEGVKARINIPDGTDEKFVKNPNWNQRFNIVAQRNGVSLVEGLERFESWWEKDVEAANTASATRLGYVPNAGTLPVYVESLGVGNATEVKENARKLFHDVSFVSQGIFTDTYNGGLKTDLSLAFEMPWFSEGTWKKGFRDIKQFHGSGEKNNLNLLSKFKVPADEKWWTTQPDDGLGYLYEIATGETSRNGNNNMDYLRGPTWDLVRNYYRLYKREDEQRGFRGLKPRDKDSWIAVGSKPYSYTAGDPSRQFRGTNLGGWFGPKASYSHVSVRHTLKNWKSRGTLLPEYNGQIRKTYSDGNTYDIPFIIPQSMRITPVVRRMVLRSSIIMNQDTAALCFDPIFTIHNPYNVPIEFYGLGGYWTKFYPFQFRLTRTDTDENGKPKNWPGTNKHEMTYNFVDIMGNVAGNIACVARVFAGTDDVNKASNGTIRMEPGEVKVVFPTSTAIMNQAGMDSNMVISVGDFTYEEKGAAAIRLPNINLSQLSSSAGTQEQLNFKIDFGPFENVAATDSRYNDLDQIAFNLYYPIASTGENLETVKGVQRIWRNKGLDMTEISDENFIQLLAFRRYLPMDGGWRNDVASGQQTGGTGVLNAEKTFFAYIDVWNQTSKETPLAGPLVTNPRAWVMDPRAWDANMKERNVALGWKKTINTDSGVSPVQYSSGKGFWGDSVGQGEGQTNIVLFEIPTAPLLSLGQLQHVECSVLDTEPGYVIGNSYPHIGIENLDELFFWPEEGYMRDGVGERVANLHSPQPRADTPFAANMNLFDRYFFSGINFGNADSAQPKDIDAFVEKVFSGSEKDSPFPNKRVSLIRDFGDRKEADVKQDFYDPEKVARNLTFNGAFNINSTSVEAWIAVLSGLQGKMLLLDGKFKEISDTPFARFVSLIGKSLGGFGKVGDNFGDDGNGWRWYVEANEDEIRKLAESMVEQVKRRGPFMSMGDFVNRRLDKGNTGKAGALQAAIDDSKINKNRSGGFGDSGATNPDTKRYPQLFSTDEKTEKKGVPGYVTQGDILSNVGASFSARSDTFTIRAYGDISGITGTPEARAWCEAVVQRVPEFFNPQADENEEMIDSVKFLENYRERQSEGQPRNHVLEKWERNDKLSAVNALFGRRYKIISFRWLSQDEI
ncbi:MAG: hypothetical protein E7037_04930 [Verrucomicrobia bacterium]|nr:hypothetical protein [Verrucomicrobiota bacterium]